MQLQRYSFRRASPYGANVFDSFFCAHWILVHVCWPMGGQCGMTEHSLHFVGKFVLWHTQWRSWAMLCRNKPEGAEDIFLICRADKNTSLQPTQGYENGCTRPFRFGRDSRSLALPLWRRGGPQSREREARMSKRSFLHFSVFAPDCCFLRVFIKEGFQERSDFFVLWSLLLRASKRPTCLAQRSIRFWRQTRTCFSDWKEGSSSRLMTICRGVLCMGVYFCVHP